MKTERKKISLGGSATDMLVVMAEGNPGAIRIMTEVIEKKKENSEWLRTLLDLDDMNMRGSQIWCAYKIGCGEDLDQFIKRVNDRDPELVKAVNDLDESGRGPEVAVIGGGSFEHVA